MSAVTFPVGLHLEKRRCLVVGGAAEAAARAQNLLDAGACVSVVSTEPSQAIETLAQTRTIELARRNFAESDLDEAWLVVLTDGDRELARRIGAACEARRIFFCATDVTAHNGFSHMAIARAGFVKIAISTDGRAPALARRLREELQRVLDAARLSELAERLAALRLQTPSAERARVLGAAVRGLRFEGDLVVPEG